MMMNGQAKTTPKCFELCVDRVSYRGEGYAKTPDGAIYRVSNALTGERITAFDVSMPRHRLAYLDQILDASSDATPPFCDHWRDCAACQYCRLTAAAQQKLKEAHWLRLIRRFVPDAACTEAYAAVRTLAYRHRARARFSRGTFVMPVRMDARLMLDLYPDFSAERIESEIPLHDCCLHAECLNDCMKHLEKIILPYANASLFEYDIEAFEDHARLTIYAAPDCVDSGRRLAQMIAESGFCADEKHCVILQPIPARGSHVYPPSESFGKSIWYTYARNGHQACLEAMKGAWTPVNPDNASRIREILKSCLEMPMPAVNRVLELGCGCGTHSDIFDDLDVQYHGIDASWPAIQSAQHNAYTLAWQNKTFQTSTALHYLDKNYYRGARADLVLMHSNRLPYGRDVVAWCKRFGAHTILIVAPSAYAMARECQDFIETGYQLQKLFLCDTLPFTYHMMAVAMLQQY